MTYDKVFITSQPSFYKIKLWNEVARRCYIFVIFTQDSDASRNKDFYREHVEFDHAFILGNKLLQTIDIIRWFIQNQAIEIIYGGWDRIPCLVLALLSRKKHNSTIVESTIFESCVSGPKSLIKRIFMSRMAKAYVPGTSNALLANALGIKGEIVKTGGCGILNYVSQPIYVSKSQVKNFIFVGRLIPVKNLELLISVFNSLSHLNLTIVGFGELESKLKGMSNNNIFFTGSIDNESLPNVYKQHDVFILPSKSETWGLVVEEALNNGLPVIVSNRVGCGADLVTSETGLLFDYNSEDSLRDAVLKMTDISYYNQLRYNVSKMDFYERANNQIKAFSMVK